MTSTLTLSPAKTFALPLTSPAQVREALLNRQEIVLLDVREEDEFAQAHPLFAAQLSWGRLELEAWRRIPRRDVPIVVYDDAPRGPALAESAAQRLLALGYTRVSVLEGGLAGWEAAGGELFRDVNVPSKSFGELVESRRHTPSLAAEEVQGLLDGGADVVVVDVRRFDEYQTMNIPGSTSLPGAELVLRIGSLAPDPTTRVIVNCAGRTRSIIGTQSLVNAGIPNPVAALRNGTIGWVLAGQTLERGADRRYPAVDPALAVIARQRARAVADRAGVGRATLADVARWRGEAGRTTYTLDVRTPEEYRAGHLPGFAPAPGGQLVQETDFAVPVRGARVVLADRDGVRANMTASWLAQMAWEVYVLDGVPDVAFTETGEPSPSFPPPPAHLPEHQISVAELRPLLADPGTVVIDLTTHVNYLRGHLPSAWFALRARLDEAVAEITRHRAAAGVSVSRYVLTCATSRLADYALPELEARVAAPVWVLTGGTQAWQAAGLALETGAGLLASPPIDRYRRPYEGTDNPREAMQAYLDWEFGLVAQLARDGTHGFFVI